MQIKAYRDRVPPPWLTKGSFPYRNPNLSYLLFPEGKDGLAILIDAGSGLEERARDLKEKGLTPAILLLTHTHHDHVLGLPELLKQFPGLKIGAHKSALPALSARGYADLLPLEEGMVIDAGETALSVIHAPGHTTDSLCFWDQKGNNFFSGDVIFGGNIGCSDYRNGGNRNVFYQTILRLLKLLPPSTDLYPGHYSEIHQAPPPYRLAGEQEKNPYLADARAGKRGHFDRALKEFSVDFEVSDDYVQLEEKDLDAIEALEKEIWIPELQASRETISTRLRRGHRLIAGMEQGRLTGMVGWCYSKFSLADGAGCFPRTFAEFSTCTSCKEAGKKSAFIYNVGIAPAGRGKGAGSILLQRAFEEIGKEKIVQVFLDSRLPSYRGSLGHVHENVPPHPLFRDAIDGYFTKNRFPNREQFALDPAVRFYLKNGFRPWIIIKDFIADAPSGDMRVICYLNLEQDEEP